MTISEQLTEDMKTSMKAGDAQRTGVLRLLRGALKDEEIKQGHTALDEAASLAVLQRQAKQRRDSIEAYRAAGRDDLLAQEQIELEVIAHYLPEALTQEELDKLVDEVISELGAAGPGQMGQVIGAVMKRAGARADGGSVSQAVRSRLGA